MRRKRSTFDRWVDEQDWPDERVEIKAPPENWVELSELVASIDRRLRALEQVHDPLVMADAAHHGHLAAVRFHRLVTEVQTMRHDVNELEDSLGLHIRGKRP